MQRQTNNQTNKQTQKSWTSEIVANEAILGKEKKSSMVHTRQTGTRRLSLVSFHHKYMKTMKQAQKSWTNKNLANQAFLGKGKQKSSMVHTRISNHFSLAQPKRIIQGTNFFNFKKKNPHLFFSTKRNNSLKNIPRKL